MNDTSYINPKDYYFILSAFVFTFQNNVNIFPSGTKRKLAFMFYSFFPNCKCFSDL